MISDKKKVHNYRDKNPKVTYQEGKKVFGEMAESSLHTNWYSWKSKTKGNITSNLILSDFDTVKESILAYQKDNYKGIDALHKIHLMKLRPIKQQKNKLSPQEQFKIWKQQKESS